MGSKTTTKEAAAVGDTEAAPAGAPPIEEVAAGPEPVKAQPEPQRVSISEACTRMLDKAPGAYAGLYAFQREEEEAGRVNDSFEAYRTRYQDFMRRPT